jgi:hypothetical protein
MGFAVSKFVAVSIATLVFSLFAVHLGSAADLVTAPSVREPATAEGRVAATSALRDAASEYLSLLMIRATFDVVDKADLEAELADELRIWGGQAPSIDARADLDRQMLAEGSYYLISLSYTVKVGGAAFPDDKAEMVYANDAIVELDALQAKLADTIVEGGDTLPILQRAEQIRALTEGHSEMPADFGVFKDHAAILDRAIETAARGART